MYGMDGHSGHPMVPKKAMKKEYPHLTTHHPHDGDLVHGYNTGQSPLHVMHPDHNPMSFPKPRRGRQMP